MGARPKLASTPQPHFVSGATALYAQLASVLRSRVLSGEWAYGEDIPSIDELCASYGLGRITVRQALQILAEEGLVASQRGRRTYVTYAAGEGDAKPLFSSIAALDQRVPNYTIRIVSRTRVTGLPAKRWPVGTDAGAYLHFVKIDHDDAQAYCLSSVYIAEDVYKRFPKGAENTAKLAQLTVKYANPKLASGRERLTVLPADFDVSQALDYPMAAPVARAERVFCDVNGRVVYYGVSNYRGDRFGLERDMTEYLLGEKRG
ncbi:GntR family transcriptional regulator [Ramlibacter sp.]|uniref:GntR family transcriptional regulator n=1 Tax=Ramlibacter sp. TaxID=1917967 RepID=UPI003D0C71D4